MSSLKTVLIGVLVLILDLLLKNTFYFNLNLFFCFLIFLMVNDFVKALIGAAIGGIIFDVFQFYSFGTTALIWLMVIFIALLLEKIFSFSTTLGVLIFSLLTFLFLALLQGALNIILLGQQYFGFNSILGIIINGFILFLILRLNEINLKKQPLIVSAR